MYDLQKQEKINEALKNPAKGGTPAMARQAIKNVIWVMGKYFLNPPISFISLL